MTREKEDLTLHDTHYRRDFLTYDNQLLDGELFLQVSFWMSIITLATQMVPIGSYSFDSQFSPTLVGGQQRDGAFSLDNNRWRLEIISLAL